MDLTHDGLEHRCGTLGEQLIQPLSFSLSDARTQQKFTDECDVFISATGAVNRWVWPNIKGLHTFKGKLVHSANYDTNIDVTGKRVALVGGGSSGIQILPKIQPKAARVFHFMKGRTWIPPMGFGAQSLAEQGGDRK